MPSATTQLPQLKHRSLYGFTGPRALLLVALALCFVIAADAQSGAAKKIPAPASASAAQQPPTLTRTTTRHETRRFAYGNALVIYGAPAGSITVEAWPRNEVDITADIELRADTEEDLTRLAAVNNFVLDEDSTRLTLITTGTHDRKFMKRTAKNFPKNLLDLPWKIDYHLRVPALLALDIYAGRGPLTINGVEGALYINAGEAPATLTLTGGDVQATFLGGPLTLRIPAHSWRGRGVNLRLARGDLTVELPAAFNAELDAHVLRAGSITNAHPSVAPRERTTPTERTLAARVGAGGAALNFEVTDGTITIKQVPGDK
ncbi:MAG TPA: hypothetical protein VF525_14050 [Pyrinomonadaceae bacterium]